MTIKDAMIETQARLVTRFFGPCERIWWHAEQAGIPVKKRREDIEKMITDAVRSNITLAATVARNAATEICDRLDKSAAGQEVGS